MANYVHSAEFPLRFCAGMAVALASLAGAWAQDDHGDWVGSATLLPLGPTLGGTLAGAEDLDVFRIDLAGDAAVEVRTSGPTDTRGELRDVGGGLVASDDDSGPGGHNFRIEEPLAAGIYYVAVSGAVGDYSITARLADALDQGDTAATSSLLTLYSEAEVARVSPSILLATPARIWPSTADVDVFRLDVPHDRTAVTVRSSGSPVHMRLVDSSLTEVTADNQGGNARLEATLDAGVHYVLVGGHERGDYRLLAWGDAAGCPCALQPAVRDVGDEPESSALLRLGGAQLAGVVGDAADVDVFRLDVAGDTRVEVRASGPTDTRGELLDGTGARIASDDDSGPGSNFRIEETLAAGIYYVAVTGAQGNYSVGARLADALDQGGTVAASALLPVFTAEQLASVSPAMLLGTSARIWPGTDDVDAFRLDVPHDDTALTVRTAGSPVHARLVDSSLNELALDDHGGDARIEAELDAGIYYVLVSAHEVGSYRILASGDSENACPCAAADSGGLPQLTVSGVVRWSDGGVVKGAVVRARNLATGQVVAEATTDGAGSYRIERLTDKRYQIEVTTPSGFSHKVPERIERQSADDPAERTFDVPLPISAQAGAAVAIVPAGDLVRKAASFFDLEGKTVTFTPAGENGYTVTVGGLEWDAAVASGARTQLHYYKHYVTVDLPFPFPFAGRTWTRVYANGTGNLSFYRPEDENWPNRSPWSAGTVRHVAAAVDSRAVAGFESMIAALWAIYEDVTVSVDSSSAGVTVTWRGGRRDHGHVPLGENEFQARLRPSGVVELAFRKVAERDGIVGLFHGADARGASLDVLTDQAGDVSHPMLDIVRAELVDNGSTILARIELAADVPQVVPRSSISYEVKLASADWDCALGIRVDQTGQQPIMGWWCGEPNDVGAWVLGNVIEIAVSKTVFHGSPEMSWRVSAIWWDEGYDGTEAQTVQVSSLDRDLSALASGQVAGNVFEVFHYPVFQNRDFLVLSHIYQHTRPNAEIGVAFTDFRTDDLYNVGAGTGPINTTAQGIGRDRPQDGERWGSFNILTSMETVFIGGANFRETGTSRDWQYRAHAPGVRWIAHEAVHRWSAHLSFRNPHTGQIEPLGPTHWKEYVHAPAAHPVWPGFADTPYVGASVMGGNVWRDNGDGTFTEMNPYTGLPTGLSALDLYAMGMIPASEVPDTFILRDVEETSTHDTVRATKVPVRIEDIIAAMGPRAPNAATERKDFRLGIYLLHENNRPPSASDVQHAASISAATIDYFDLATAGRMRVIPAPIASDERRADHALTQHPARWSADSMPTSRMNRTGPKRTIHHDHLQDMHRHPHF